MAKLSKTLKVYKNSNGVTESIELYSTTGETGGSYVPLTVDGVNCYARLGGTSDSSASSLAVYKNSNGGEYRVAKRGMYTVTINQSSNQEIKVSCNGSTYTSSFTAPFGSSYSASVTPATNYKAGTLSSSSGTVTGDITISATSATYSPPYVDNRCGCKC